MSSDNVPAVKDKHYVYEKPRSFGNIFALINEENRRNAEVTFCDKLESLVNTKFISLFKIIDD